MWSLKFNYNFSMKPLFICMVSAILALYSCQSSVNKQLVKTNSYSRILKDLQENKKAIKLFQIFELDNQLTAFYLNEFNNSLNFVQLDGDDSNFVHKKFQINEILKKDITQPAASWLVINYDSIIAISNKNKQAYIFNVYDEILDSLPLYTPNNLDNYVCFSSDFGTMTYSNNKLIVPVSAEVVYQEEKNEYQAISGLIIDLSSKEIIKITRTSESKIFGVSSYANPYDYLMVWNEKVYFSSEEDSFLYAYDYHKSTYSKSRAKSDYIVKVNPYPDSLKMNRSARKDFITQEPRYSRIGFTSPHTYMYRVAKHRSIIEKNKGYYKEEAPKSQYSLILLDTNGLKVDEILIPNENVSDYILPTHKGLVLFNEKSDINEKGLLCLDLFEIK